jgi:hypothetical protein
MCVAQDEARLLSPLRAGRSRPGPSPSSCEAGLLLVPQSPNAQTSPVPTSEHPQDRQNPQASFCLPATRSLPCVPAEFADGH